MAKTNKERTSNDQRSTVKNPTSEEHKLDAANTEKQKEAAKQEGK